MNIDPQIPIGKLVEDDSPEVEGHGWIADAVDATNPAAIFSNQETVQDSESASTPEGAASPSDDTSS